MLRTMKQSRNARRAARLIAAAVLSTGWLSPTSTAQPSASEAAANPAPAPARAEYLPDASSPFLPFDEAWPARWNPLGEKSQGVVWPLNTKVSKLGTLRLPGTPVIPSVDEKLIFAELCKSLSAPGEPPPTLELEGRNSIIFIPNAGGRKRDFSNNFGFGLGPGAAAGPDAELVFVFASGQLKTPPADAAPGIDVEPTVEMQRTWFAYYDAMGNEQSQRDASGRAVARAAVLLMPGMFGTPEVVLDPLTLRLRANGYGVLRMLSQPSRFTERLIVRADPDDLDRSAAEVGAVVNNRLGECAFAVDAAWEFVHSKRDGTRSLPHAAIGVSGGAISLPTVAARSPSLYSAAVLIGGGADFWLINERSNYQGMIEAVRTVWVGAAATPETIAAFDTKLLTTARLDAFHTASVLKGIPTLMLQASGDRAVPSALGDVLWERLGRPERWMYPASHEVLCLGLPAEADRILAWLDAAFASQAKNAPPGAAPKLIHENK